MKIIKNTINTVLLVMCYSCGPKYVQDPNAHTVVTVQYEDGPVKIVPRNDCKPQLDCAGKSEADCAAGLYNASEAFIKEGQRLEEKELYVSATVEYLQAMTRLSEAEIRLNKAKTDSYEDWRIAVIFGLEKKIKKRIKYCQSRIDSVKWRR